MKEVVAAYNSEFREGAYSLAGVFDSGKWIFSLRDQISVRKLTESVYGYDGLTTPPKVDVRVVFTTRVMSDPYQSIDILSRPVARATGRPGVLMGHGIIRGGGEISKLGSRVCISEGAEFTFRDVPYSLFEVASRAAPREYSVTRIDPEFMMLEQLFFEHDQLCKRYQEIQALFELSGINPPLAKSLMEEGRSV